MKKRNLFALFLGLFSIGLASCGSKGATTTFTETTKTIETTTTQTTNHNYALDEDTRKYLLQYCDNSNVKLPSKKYSYEEETERDNKKQYIIINTDDNDKYCHKKTTYSFNDDCEETYTYLADGHLVYVAYRNDELSYVSYSGASYQGQIVEEYEKILSYLKLCVYLENDDYMNVSSYELKKHESGTFDFSITVEEIAEDMRYLVSIKTTFINGFLHEYSLATTLNSETQITNAKFTYDVDFVKECPSMSLTQLEEYVYDDYMKSYIKNDPIADEDKLVDMDNNRTYYQLLVYSFADGDGDGVGDFKGIIDHLDYLVDLGVEGLWLSPVLEATSYHSYDIENYYQIRYAYEVTVDGVTYDFNYLLKECHKRNIKVLMDLVINHSSHYNNFEIVFPFLYGDDNRFGFPEFDFDKPLTRKLVEDIGTYWLERGVDGFRLDAAMWIYNSGNDRHEKNYEFWTSWCKKMKEVKPDCYIIGEVLDENHDLAYDYAKAGFDSTFDFNALGTVINAVKDSTYDYASNTMANVNKALANNSNYILGRALSNHDIGRFNQAHPDSNDKAYYVDSVEEIKLANALNALTPGNTFIYYGDELGLLGTCKDTKPNYYYDMNYRTPMPFEDERTDSVNYFYYFHGQGITTSDTITGQTVEEIVADSNSIYNKLKEALALKNSSEVLQKGTLTKVEGLLPNLSGFDVKYNGTTIRILYVSSDINDTVSLTVSNGLLYNLGADVNGINITLSKCDLIAFVL